MEMLQNVERKTIKVGPTPQVEELSNVDKVIEKKLVNFLIEEIALELNQLKNCMNLCGNNAAIMKQEVFRRVEHLQRRLARSEGWRQ